MWYRIWAFMLRYLYLYRRSPARIIIDIFWPGMTLLVWGFFVTYLSRVISSQVVIYLLGAIILWDVLQRSQQQITLAITEEYWVRNIINIFIAPVTAFELALANCIFGVIRAVITAGLLSIMAYGLYSFNITSLGPILILFVFNLLIFGWSLGLLTMGLVFRFGHVAERLIWTVPVVIQPLSAVFYPVDVLPPWLQLPAKFLPSTHIFESLRAGLTSGQASWSVLGLVFLLNLVWLIFGAFIYGWMLKVVKEKGYLTRQSME